MTYEEWMTKHKQDKHDILNRNEFRCIEDIVEYFDYENMKEKEKDFCPLYKDNIKCHNIDKLNCYYCACPHFVVNKFPKEIGKTTIASICNINSKHKAEFYENPDKNNVVKIHCDCTNCFIPHKDKYVLNRLYIEADVFRKISECSSFIEYLRNK